MRFPLIAILLLTTIARADSPESARVVSVENCGLLFTDNKSGVSGTDAGYSIPIGNRTVWLFGDVFLLHPTDPAKRFVGGLSICALTVPAGHGVNTLSSY